ncbi:MAG: LysM peptidoglycan-binding domain-containing protein [Bdellovibrionales bacterium]|nr:LysM peptidoglycan-binding domain-containing protein [Bdellovibrionales bacterium]
MKIFLATLLMSVSAMAYDGGADRSFEKRMHDIYKSSYSVEVSDSDWANYVEKIESPTYKVRPGDTLWDLSKVFFGDGFFWSKIWSFNEKLTNPHLIYPGAEIRFFTGSINTPPSLQVDGTEVNVGGDGEGGDETSTSKATGTMTITKSSTGNGGLYPNAPDLPPSMTEVTPVLSQIPPIFKEEPLDSNLYDKKGMSFDVRPPVRVNPLFVPNAFIFNGDLDEYPHFGKVIESEDWQELPGRDTLIYIESSKGLSKGDRVTLLGKDFKLDRLDAEGVVLRYMGIGEVVDILDNNRYRLSIVQSLTPIEPDALVTNETIPSFADDNSGRPSDVAVTVVGGEIENQRSILGRGNIIFLKGGTNNGVRVNDVLGIYKNREARHHNSKVSQSPRPVAQVKIFRSEPGLASAFIISSKEPIQPGDMTGPPESVSGPATESERNDLKSIEKDLDFDEGAAFQ